MGLLNREEEEEDEEVVCGAVAGPLRLSESGGLFPAAICLKYQSLHTKDLDYFQRVY